ncbi:MAG TPA: hypothetical protein VE991_01765 [Acidimicrobiales bacterium]|nr:hypothetical protein [Acidimicrobiales bacterium]
MPIGGFLLAVGGIIAGVGFLTARFDKEATLRSHGNPGKVAYYLRWPALAVTLAGIVLLVVA